MNEKEGWEEIIVESQIWSPEKIGDSIQGVYIEMKTNVGQWNKNRYTLELEKEERYVYGTTDLDEKFKRIQIGDEVHIELKKCIKSRPPKKPFKVFQVFRRPGPDRNNMGHDDPEAEETIRWIRENEVGANASDEQIIAYAEAWEDLTEEDVSRIKICLAKNKKTGGK